MPEKLTSAISKVFQTRDELSFNNIRRGMLPALLVFPLAVIMGNLRFYDHGFAFIGFGSSQLLFFLLGLGYLTVVFIPKRFFIPVLRLAAIISVILPVLLFFLPTGFTQYVLYMVLKYFNGLCAACAFYLFCFLLNNAERLTGLAIIQLYFGLYYAVINFFPAVYTAGEGPVSLIVTALFLAAVFLLGRKQKSDPETEIKTEGRGSGVPFVVGLGVIQFIIMSISNYIEWTEHSISGLAFGLGTLISILLVIIFQFLKGRNALYIWLMFLAFTLFGLAGLLFDTTISINTGSFAYGLGDSLGHIIFAYLCAGAIKRGSSLRMFKLYCLVYFAEYSIITWLFSHYFSLYEGPDKALAFSIVLILVCLCFLFLPLIQKKLFDADWTDGLYLKDMKDYSRPLAESEEINTRNHLNLTPRETEIFTMLLEGKAPKEIGFTLKVSYDTVCFHQKNLYRKLGIQSRAELFAKYSSSETRSAGKAANG